MFRHQFPDLAQLKSQISDRFSAGNGWPNVVLNVKATDTWRPDIKGPLSLFLNIQGFSRCGTNNGLTSISDRHYYLTNRHENYTLAIDGKANTETFNIHFGEQFMEEVLEGLITPADLLLADSFRIGSGPVYFFNKLYPRTPVFNQLISNLYHHHTGGATDKLLLEEQLYNVLVYLLHEHRNLLKEIQKLPQIKSATRTELYKRLSHSLDYIYTHFCRQLELDELAAEACISKYHYLRVFKLAFGCSPYQMVQKLRLEKAQQLLAKTSLPVSDISVQLGFGNLSSFSRLFHQRTKYWPKQYRELAA